MSLPRNYLPKSEFHNAVARPGWRIPWGGSEHDALLRDSQRKAIEEAHAEYLDYLTNAWKGGRRTAVVA